MVRHQSIIAQKFNSVSHKNTFHVNRHIFENESTDFLSGGTAYRGSTQDK